MSALSDFFILLGQDALLMEEYLQNPETVMRAHGLSDEEIDTVMSGDLEKLKSLSGDGDYKTFLLVNHGNN
ncbi:hypothetical protein [Shewanella putrefaciens]|uniref:Extradiol ring-cleavage dioxygenase LigAB LigA subunit domain-containing protein n=1 Tax=Shewanella putrefaciens TaxID=24 RepID=A0ABX8XEJ6_SHEPU|nr:hypothetical protein [Shewanella putrefaciens]CAD6366343.1 hypothetical protein SHEWT2_01009 [Shewanella hafniensis]AVV83180.1 hypothetical protein SPWS13_1371 [Shewanella putrefaciens]MCT8942442.1 hypothetical protein [Shewanella putrefaciens]QSE50522.1 hypothetical protein JW975_05825 [Shewanella putrefaciens]QYX73932.1 hypothetical protein K3G22_05815 [Shewanella putrefaciens]